MAFLMRVYAARAGRPVVRRWGRAIRGMAAQRVYKESSRDRYGHDRIPSKMSHTPAAAMSSWPVQNTAGAKRPQK